MYTEDFDRVPRNTGSLLNGKIPQEPSWVAGVMTFETFQIGFVPLSDSTNKLLLVGPNLYCSIGDYSKSPDIYKYPADRSCFIFPGGACHERVRSYSLNFMIGAP